MLMSLVVPCFNEEAVLPIFLEQCEEVMRSMKKKFDLNFEIVFVDDGSSDRTLEVIKESSIDQDICDIRWISFSRNYGKEATLVAGLEAARGYYVVVMDADLQDPPSLLPKMYECMLETNCDCVATKRATRKGEPAIRSLFSRAFYGLINALSEVEFVSGERDYRMMKRPVVDAILSMDERVRFIKDMYGWVGFDTQWISYDNVERKAGKTKWSFMKLVSYAFTGISSFSTLPLQLSSIASLLLIVILLIAIVFIIIRYLVFGDPVAGWASTACIILFVGSLQLFCLGILGQYLAKTYIESKGRPLYIVKESSDADQ